MDSNHRPQDYESCKLTAALSRVLCLLSRRSGIRSPRGVHPLYPLPFLSSTMTIITLSISHLIGNKMDGMWNERGKEDGKGREIDGLTRDKAV